MDPVIPTYRRIPPDPCPWPGTPTSRKQAGALILEELGGPPTVTSLVPPSAKLGDPSFTLHVHGTNFRADAQIVWNGSPEPTTFVSPTEVTTMVNMATASVAMAIPVAVSIGGGLVVSNAMNFDLQPAS
jgi:IPT/TIG domain